MWTESKRRRWHQAVDTQVVGDGAAWIWNLVGDYFYDAYQVVDWFHATEHLALAAHLAFGESNQEALRWLKQQETPLQQAGYFANNQHRMHYLEMRSDGWLIGSGMVESGGKRFKDRFTGSGMRWSRAGAERLLPVGAALLSRPYDERWRAAHNSPPN